MAGEKKCIVGYSDSDWAVCRVTGKSTSGGALMIGSHLMKAWSRTQNHVTISSVEAELYAMVKCTAELIGIKSMMRDWGHEKSGALHADSTAALGIPKRNVRQDEAHQHQSSRDARSARQKGR